MSHCGSGTLRAPEGTWFILVSKRLTLPESASSAGRVIWWFPTKKVLLAGKSLSLIYAHILLLLIILAWLMLVTAHTYSLYSRIPINQSKCMSDYCTKSSVPILTSHMQKPAILCITLIEFCQGSIALRFIKRLPEKEEVLNSWESFILSYNFYIWADKLFWLMLPPLSYKYLKIFF